jgi:hypothetical protein
MLPMQGVSAALGAGLGWLLGLSVRGAWTADRGQSAGIDTGYQNMSRQERNAPAGSL